MEVREIGVIMNGVTGRMGTNQHLIRSIVAIREEGGVEAGPGLRIMPKPLLVGRNEDKLLALSVPHGGLPYTTNLDEALHDPKNEIYFDALATNFRFDNVKHAIEAGKHVYCEKPCAETSDQAMDLYRRAETQHVKHGVVQDKLWLPGFRKLRHLVDTGFFGEILSVRGEFGYWVFTGEDQPAQRPSWNYRKEDGGGIIVDMLCHWRYVIDNLFGNVTSVSCLGATHIPERYDESGKPYAATSDDAAYATFETESGVICHFNSSWCVRVRRDDLVTLQVDGTRGSAVAGLRKCYIQPHAATPRPVWNPDVEPKVDYWSGWQEMPDNAEYRNAFKEQWALFLKHVVNGDPFPWTLKEGAKGVQLAELGLQSWSERRWIDVPNLS